MNKYVDGDEHDGADGDYDGANCDNGEYLPYPSSSGLLFLLLPTFQEIMLRTSSCSSNSRTANYTWC